MRPNPELPHPDHVPAERVYDFDLYNPPGVGSGFHEAWRGDFKVTHRFET